MDKDMKIKSLEEIYLFSLPIKGSEIIDFFLEATLKEEVLNMNTEAVQTQTRAGQRHLLPLGDYNGHVSPDVKCPEEVAIVICEAILLAKLLTVPCSEATRGTRLASPTLACKVSTAVALGAPRDTGLVSAPVPKRLLLLAGIRDCYTSARGCTAIGNFTKATSKTYSYLTPKLWKETVTTPPYQEFTDHLVKTHTAVSVQRPQVPAVTHH
uniref:Small ribosomal subunit protein uS5 C-terminal domain-containing protein n=1 Tax=Myotis lucifugus TaxID=59463 RepID=G1Q8I7_MYOLU